MKDFNEHLTEAKRGTIYCDLDGVLVDLLSELSRLYGMEFTEENFDKNIAKVRDDLNENHPNLFATLPWMSDGKKLWAFLGQHNASILTSAPRSWLPNGIIDKAKWAGRELSPRAKEVVIVKGSSEKKRYATTNGVPNILIDDYGQNVKEWTAAGGIGIHHKNAADTISKLKKLLRS